MGCRAAVRQIAAFAADASHLPRMALIYRRMPRRLPRTPLGLRMTAVLAMALCLPPLGCDRTSIGLVDAAADTAGQPAPDASADDAGAEAGVFVCDVPAPTVCPDPPPRFADVAPLFQQRCVPCHFGAEGGPWPLITYRHVTDWYDFVRDDIRDCSMPPPDSGIPMTSDERQAVLTWLLCGFPE